MRKLYHNASPHACNVALRQAQGDTSRSPRINQTCPRRVTVQIAVTIDPSGKLVAEHVFKSSGNQAIDEAALQSASGSKYSPKLVDCQAVTADYLFRVDFDPNSSASGPAGSYATVPADLPRGSEWENPFCNGSAIAVPWDAAQNAAANGSSSKTVAVFFWANANSDYEARVTLIGNGAAYGVDIPRTAVTSSPDGELRRYAYLVSLRPPSFSITISSTAPASTERRSAIVRLL